MSADHTNPNGYLGLDVIFGQAFGGREVVRNLWLEGGFRRMALNVAATIADSAEVHRKPGFWDPLVGVSYRRPLGRKLRLDLHTDGGGFGVGSDIDIAATGEVDWRFANHFGVTAGYGLLYFKSSDTVARRTLTIDPTLNGPIFGFGIYC